MSRPLVLAACAAATLSGCGGGGEKAAPRTETVPRGREAQVSGREYQFSPGGLVVSAGRVRFRFANDGSLAHDLRVLRSGRDLGGTPAFRGGSRSFALKLPPGTYRMVCTVGDHATLGMTASLRVRARN